MLRANFTGAQEAITPRRHSPVLGSAIALQEVPVRRARGRIGAARRGATGAVAAGVRRDTVLIVLTAATAGADDTAKEGAIVADAGFSLPEGQICAAADRNMITQSHCGLVSMHKLVSTLFCGAVATRW